SIRSATSSPLLLSSFPSYLHHRDLHSFPTRRSSDLRCFNYQCTPLMIQMVIMVDVMWKGSLDRAMMREMDILRWQKSVSQSDLTDRKSTRLNSSHVSISYAVFCLKKKKK